MIAKPQELALWMEEVIAQKKAFVFWQEPHTNVLKTIVNPVLEDEPSNFTTGFLIQPFVGEAFCLKGNISVADFEQLNQYTTAAQPQLVSRFEIPISLTKTDFIQSCNAALAEIEANTIEKIVLSTTQKVKHINLNAIIGAWQTMLSQYHYAMVVFAYTPQFGLWLGASPEPLMQYSATQLNLTALAGTRTAVDFPQHPFQPKEYHEQALVTQFITSILHQNNIPITATQGPNILTAGHLLHLHTQITATTAYETAKSILPMLAPTPAVAGIPKTKAITLIQKLEPHSRNLYAGYWGPMQEGKNINLFVNLRTLSWYKNQAFVYAGCGITAASDPALEWDEIQHKLKNITNVL